MTLLSQCMTHHPITVAPHDTVQQAARLMDQYNIGCLPVCQRGELVGLLTDRDITVRATCLGLAPDAVSVAQVMSVGVRSCHHDQTADDALRLMADVQIRRLPVLDDSGRLWGIVSMGDLLARQSSPVEAALRRVCTPSEPDRPEGVGAPAATSQTSPSGSTAPVTPAARRASAAKRRVQPIDA